MLKATEYEDWWRAATALDQRPSSYDWRVNPIDELYDYKHVQDRRQELSRLRRNDNVIALAAYLRPGLLRNLFNITTLPLYDKTYTETKACIQAYIEESVEAVGYIASSTTASTSDSGRLTAQEKLDILHDSRSTFGRTALFLQGGSIFGLCHLGVVKALLENALLPKIIVGTATGALMAALVGIHTYEELPRFLNGDSIDLSAFAESSQRARQKTEEDLAYLDSAPPASWFHNWLSTLERRARRYIEQGFLLDPHVLAECVKANVGDLTFDEAYKRTGRVLNIIISSHNEATPDLMNYLTAPNVLIRSAALASFITNMGRESPIQLLYKNRDGEIRNLDIRPPGPESPKKRRFPSAADPSGTPTARLKQQFNVDHFIISQARPYVAPFVMPSLPHVRERRIWLGSLFPTSLLWHYPTSFVKHGMLLAVIVGWLPDNLRRVLSDETVRGDCLTLVPEVHIADWRRLLKNPTKDKVDYWIMRGERSVWPSICALKVRCLIEVALDRAYEQVRRRKPYDPLPTYVQLQEPLARHPSAPLPILATHASIADEAEQRRRKTPRKSIGNEAEGFKEA